MKRGVDFVGVGVVAICHDGNGEYLFEYRSDKCRDEHFTWSNVGSGGLELGETLDEALRREVTEECGTEPVKVEYLGFREVFREQDGVKSHYISFDFKVELDREKVRNMEPEKSLELKWFTLDQIPTPMHSQLPFFLEKYKDIL